MYERIRNITPEGRDVPLGVRFVGESVCDSKFFISRKNSELTSLEYIVSGTGTLEIQGKTMHPKSGDIFLITEGSSHRYFSSAEDGWHKYFVSFYGPAAEKLTECYLPRDCFLFEGCRAEESFRRMVELAFGAKDLLAAQVEIAAELFRVFNLIYEGGQSRAEDSADRIKRHIDNCVGGGFSLDELCSSMNYSKNHLINIFSEKFKLTPYQYYLKRKIETAEGYLAGTAMTVSEISNALAYSDPQYFSNAFKKATGRSPRDYRRFARGEG